MVASLLENASFSRPCVNLELETILGATVIGWNGSKIPPCYLCMFRLVLNAPLFLR